MFKNMNIILGLIIVFIIILIIKSRKEQFVPYPSSLGFAREFCNNYINNERSYNNSYDPNDCINKVVRIMLPTAATINAIDCAKTTKTKLGYETCMKKTMGQGANYRLGWWNVRFPLLN